MQDDITMTSAGTQAGRRTMTLAMTQAGRRTMTLAMTQAGRRTKVQRTKVERMSDENPTKVRRRTCRA